MTTQEQKKVILSTAHLAYGVFSLINEFEIRAEEQGWTQEEIREVIQRSLKGTYCQGISTIMKHVIKKETS